MSKAMRKLTGLIAKQRIALVFTNQLREKLGVMFGDKYTTSGGKALGFHASVRCRLAKLGQIKVGKEPIGIIVQAKVIKNRLGPPLRTCDINIFFDRGIDRYGSWLNALKVQKLIDVSGKTITIGSTTISKNKWNETLATDSKLREDVYKIICDAYIMKYKSSAETVDGDFEESGDDD